MADYMYALSCHHKLDLTSFHTLLQLPDESCYQLVPFELIGKLRRRNFLCQHAHALMFTDLQLID
jgi:hypothetical protein